MTNEEAMLRVKGYLEDLLPIDAHDEVEAIMTALKAEPCEDAVSRKAMEECKESMTDINGDIIYAVRMSDIRKLPPATLKPKIAQWVVDKNLYKCTACNELCTVAGYASCISEEQMYKVFKHCPSCGIEIARGGMQNDNIRCNFGRV